MILNQHQEAITCFDRAIQINPNDADAWYHKGWCLSQLNRREEALACFAEANRLKPSNKQFADAVKEMQNS